MKKRLILAPDSFKGTMRANEICDIWEGVIRNHLPDAAVTRIPMADGGEGLTEAYLHVFGGQRVDCTVTGPMGKPLDAYYGILPDGSAVMEMAAAAGLELMGEARKPMTATTYGVGMMLSDAARRGVKKVLLGLGGSATNDCGVGMAAALGYRFADANGRPVEPLAKNLGSVASVTPPEKPLPLSVTAACDVDNPLCGPNGATYTFGPQKGVTKEQLPVLDAALKHFADVIMQDIGKDVAEISGAGAAGGMGAAVLAFLNGELKPGIDAFLDAAQFDKLLADADCVFTGEGRMDAQSAHGKVPMGVGLRCKKAGVPCIALCGSLGGGAEELYQYGITAAFASVRGTCDFRQIQATCREDAKLLMDAVLRLSAWDSALRGIRWTERFTKCSAATPRP